MLDRPKVKELRKKIEAHLAKLDIEGFELELGNASFGSNNVRFKLEVSEVGQDGVTLTKEVTDFRNCCHRWNMEPEDLGRKFTRQGVVYEIVGCKPKSYKYPLLCKDMVSGKVYKFHPDTVKMHLESHEVA
jgi:hypothetical protein